MSAFQAHLPEVPNRLSIKNLSINLSRLPANCVPERRTRFGVE